MSSKKHSDKAAKRAAKKQSDKTPKLSGYDTMTYRRCGNSGLMLPVVSLGCWHNFGDDDSEKSQRKAVLYRAFELGITHFDLANNYGPPPGTAETNVGKVVREMPRDELIISSKAGYRMWPGPYGEWGSKKYLIASCDASLKRMKLDYFDIFYHHRPDPNTPLEESMAGLEQLVRSGKAIYAGVSNYPGEKAAAAAKLLLQLSNGRVPLTIHQPKYNMLHRNIEPDLLPAVDQHHFGVIPFSPLAQGLLTGKYIDGVPKNSRAGRGNPFLKPEHVTAELVTKLKALQAVAQKRGQSLAAMALSWILRDPRITSALIGARTVEQVEANVEAAKNTTFSPEELAEIDKILAGK